MTGGSAPTQLFSLTFNGGEKICYWCLFERMKKDGSDMEIHGLDRTADDKPRRT